MKTRNMQKVMSLDLVQKIKSSIRAVLLAGPLAVLLGATSAHAAITFDPPTTISADTDVCTDGDLVSAVNVVGGSAVTLNGVTFATGTGSFTFNFAAEYGAFGSATTPYTGLSSNYQTLLASGKFQGTGGSVTINGLAIGHQYAVQIWCNDSRAGGNYSSNVTSPGGNSVSVLYNNSGGADGGLGQFTIGRFIADAETQTFTIGDSPVISALNAIQLRDVTHRFWNGNMNGTWDTSTLNWTLSGGAATTYADGSHVVFDDTATGTTTVSVAAAVAPLSLAVTNTSKSYSIGGSAITGSTGLLKSGTGTLTLNGTSNTYTGATIINGGCLQIANAGALPATTAVNLTAGGANLTLGGNSAPLSWTSDSAVADSVFDVDYEANLVIDGNNGTRWASASTTANSTHWIYADLGSVQNVGTLKINFEDAYPTAFKLQVSNDANTWTDASATFNAGGAGLQTYKLNDGASGRYVRVYSTAGFFGLLSIWEMQAYGKPTTGAGTYTLGSLSGVAGSMVNLQGLGSTLKAGSDNTSTTFAGFLAGGPTDAFVKEGSGVLTLSGNNSSYAGSTTVNNGTLALDLRSRANNVNVNLGVCDVGSGGTLELNNSGAETNYLTRCVLLAAGTLFTGSGTITKTGTGIIDIFDGASINDFTGLFDVKEGILADQSGSWMAGAMSLNVAAGAFFDLRTSNVAVNRLTGSGTIACSWANPLVLTVGAQGGSATFAGAIQNAFEPTVAGSSPGGTIALIKTGAGIQTLTGASTYTGGTTVSNGTLLVSNTTGSGTGSGNVTVKPGATLGGTGTISGNVTFESGAKALFTTNGIIFNGTLTLNDTVVYLPAALPVGSYTLATYTGTLNGSFSSVPVFDSGKGVNGKITASDGQVVVKFFPTGTLIRFY